MKVSAQGLEQSVTVQEMQVNVEIPVDKFELPEAVKAQLESK
jgi:hypothetical protein